MKKLLKNCKFEKKNAEKFAKLAKNCIKLQKIAKMVNSIKNCKKC
jgi:hypothetical protein